MKDRETDKVKIRDNEISRVNKQCVKRMEPILDEIDALERKYIEYFNNNFTKVFEDKLIPILEELEKTPNIENIDTRPITVEVEEKNEEGNLVKVSRTFTIPVNIFQDFHKSFIKDAELRKTFESCLKTWFSMMTENIKNQIKPNDSIMDLLDNRSIAFALCSLAISTFHTRPHIVLRDNQKMAGIAMSEGDIAELSSGEGKTLSAVLPTFLHALRGKGAHVVTANSYLAKRDFNETCLIYNGLGLTCGYNFENIYDFALSRGIDLNKLKINGNPIDDEDDLLNFLHQEIRIALEGNLKLEKRKAYRCDVTFASKNALPFDFLQDCKAFSDLDIIQRKEKTGFALIDECDDIFIDEAQKPYRIATKSIRYKKGMSLENLCNMFNTTSSKIIDNVQVKDANKLTYEEARTITLEQFGQDIFEDYETYQKMAESFLRTRAENGLYVVKNDSYGYARADELYDAIVSEEKYTTAKGEKIVIADEIRTSGFGGVYCEENQKLMLFPEFVDKFISFCYQQIHARSIINENKEKIIADPNYIESKDYMIAGNNLFLSEQAFDRLMNDSNYPSIYSDYQEYMTMLREEPAQMFHCMYTALTAHYKYKKGIHYDVIDGEIKALKNGWVQDGTTFSGGVHKALELKEGIDSKKRKEEVDTTASITQKDYYGLYYDLTAGTTATSSKEIFGEIYGKGTVEIPKHVYYSFFGRRKVKGAIEPTGIEVHKTKFTKDVNDKINLIVNSIIESQRYKPYKPVLIVMTNPEEIKLLEEKLRDEKKIPFVTLTAITPKEKAAEIIAKAGAPGAVTISTEMVGRGTDIKVGGDRETIIDIRTEERIRQTIKGLPTPEQRQKIREEVEKELIEKKEIVTKQEEEENSHNLRTVGLKIITGGLSLTNRDDRQLEGRVGRNGISGICERYVCPSDLRRLGITSLNGADSIETCLDKFERASDGEIKIDDLTYGQYMKIINYAQKRQESVVKKSIKEAQQINRQSTKLLEEYRDQRRKIVCNQINNMKMLKSMIVDTIDAIISSYIKTGNADKKFLTRNISEIKDEFDIETVSLEIKQTLGIQFDPNFTFKTKFNILELRTILIKAAEERFKDKDINSSKIERILLLHNDYMQEVIPEILDNCFTKKWTKAISFSSGDEQTAFANIEFNNSRRKLLIESYKYGLSTIAGIPLESEEFRRLETKQREMYKYSIRDVGKSEEKEVIESEYEENNLSVIDRIKKIRKQVAKKDIKQKERILRRMEEYDRKGIEYDIFAMYKNLQVRPIRLVESVIQPIKLTREQIEVEKRAIKGIS